MEYVSIVLKFGQLVSVENNNDNAFTICLWCNSDIKSWSLVLWRELCLTIAYKMFVNYLVLLSFAVNKYRTQTSHYVRNKLKKAILLGFNTRCCISHHIDSILVVLVLNKMLFFANIWHQTWKAHCQVDCEYLIVFTQGPTGQGKGSWSFRKSRHWLQPETHKGWNV